VQRWKVQLRQLTPPATFPTKIEFSRRMLDEGLTLDAAEPELIRRYRLYPVLEQHYGVAAAFAQKIAALALRTETQARDFFDLKLLCDAGAAAAPLGQAQLKQLPQVRLFARLPELEIPREFRWRELRELAALVKFERRRVRIERRIEQLEQERAQRAAPAPGRRRQAHRTR
jgi:hypothetical protein